MSTPTNKSAKQRKKATAASTAEATVLIKTLKQNGKKKPNVFANVEVVGTGVRTRSMVTLRPLAQTRSGTHREEPYCATQ